MWTILQMFSLSKLSEMIGGKPLSHGSQCFLAILRQHPEEQNKFACESCHAGKIVPL